MFADDPAGPFLDGAPFAVLESQLYETRQHLIILRSQDAGKHETSTWADHIGEVLGCGQEDWRKDVGDHEIGLEGWLDGMDIALGKRDLVKDSRSFEIFLTDMDGGGIVVEGEDWPVA